MNTPYRAFRVHCDDAHTVTRGVEVCNTRDLPHVETPSLLVRVHYASLNYKDALSASGHRGITKHYPHTPGVDAAGEVVESTSADFAIGDKVIVTSYDLGMDTPGGFGEYVRVPADWCVPLPLGLSLKQAMQLGTAGLTAAMCLEKLAHTSPNDGAVLVTGASGGVGSLAVALFANAGYQVIASSGKAHAQAMLKALGAHSILARQELSTRSPRPLLTARFAAAVDTVGGTTLETVIKSLQPNGAVAACGLVAGAALQLTVYPFILRGISLLGIDSQDYPIASRRALWQKLAGEWNVLDVLAQAQVCQEVDLDGLEPAIEAILQGKVMGRVILKHAL